jgi:hypothetical protein
MEHFPKRIRLAASARTMALLFGLVVGPSFMLAGCSTGSTLADSLPQGAGGLPADAPARPVAATYEYPAVHDMPPERSAEPLTDAEQLKLERSLENARDQLENKAEQIDGSSKATKKPAKPKAGDAKTGETSGAAAKP